MIVFISDVHLRDEPNRTISEKATRGFLTENLVPQVVDAKTQAVTVVFLGDFVDINRSPYWVDGSSGNYVPWSHWKETLNQITPGSITPDANFNAGEFERHIIAVLERIRVANSTTYDLWKKFKSLDNEVWGNVTYRPKTIEFKFIPGNHDRLTQYSTSTRSKLVGDLELDDNPLNPFPWTIFDLKHAVLGLHGQVIDSLNFGGKKLPDNFASDPWYSFPALGDVVTITLGVKLYQRFSANPNVQNMLSDIDLVRPQSAALRWLQNRIAGDGALKSQLDDLIAKLGQEFLNDEFVQWGLSWGTKALIWFMGKPKSLEDVLNLFDKLSGGDQTQEEYAEEMVKKLTTGEFMTWYNNTYPSFPNIVSGHTHQPLLTPILGESDARPAMHYFNTGTWLDVVEAARGVGFARRSQVAYAVFYQDGEELKNDKRRSYWEFWEGDLRVA